MKKFQLHQVLLSLLTTAFPLLLSAQDYWQQAVNYSIDVSLNDKDNTLDGSLSIQYSNHSPDTLTYIWFHCWANAYKNDRTAFSDQLLGNGRTDFYFSNKEQRGYINHLDFRADGVIAGMQDHPQYIDVIKVLLPKPLPPGGTITLTTPFHEQLPFNFSRGGYKAGAYQITQWYPKPAVYDKKGWHPMPYLDQGEFFSEFGNFDVRITLPKAYVVAATGELQDEAGPGGAGLQETGKSGPAPSPRPGFKTLHYRQENVHDFAWFADKHFHVDHDTLQMRSGKSIHLYSFYRPESKPAWQKSIQYMKQVIRFRSSLIGEYPFGVVSVVEAEMGSEGGMEYPTITAITPMETPKDLDLLIEHEIGHNWFYAILATDERRYSWMDEGMNTYYDNRYEQLMYKAPHAGEPAPASAHRPSTKASPPRPPNWLAQKLPEDPFRLLIDNRVKEKRDQPISTASADFSADNYDLIAYNKAGLWMKGLEDSLGTPLFDSCMREYFRRWQFRHPYPEDFRQVFEQTSGRTSLDSWFARLDTKGALPPYSGHRRIKPTFLFSAKNTSTIDYINILPAPGYNMYDRFMIGALVHNYNLPPDNFRFILAPLYGTNSRKWNGIGNLNYTWFGSKPALFSKVRLGVGGERFSSVSGTDSNGNKLFGGFYKVAPSLYFEFAPASPRSTVVKWIEWKTFLIGENNLDHYVMKTSDSLYYPTAGSYAFRYLNQLSAGIRDDRVLYPYSALLGVQQGEKFYRVNFTGNYFFNYSKGGGMDVRLFAAKFGYLSGGNVSTPGITRFQPKLTAVRGYEDYTYDNYFIGRNEYSGSASHQVMMRDGDLKLRTDLFQGLQGRSDNWVSSLNLASSLPYSIIPKWLPLKIFLDVGTYAEAWKDNPPTSRFLYVGGLELALFKNILHIYAPLVYSADFSDQLKSVPDENTFWKKLSFSIDIQNFSLRKLLPPNFPL